MRKKPNAMAPLLAALQKLGEVGIEEQAIAVLCRELSTPDGQARWSEIQWRQRDKDRKQTAALTALKNSLKTCPRELPADALAWLRGEAKPPCCIGADVRAELHALVIDAQPEQTLFDEVS